MGIMRLRQNMCLFPVALSSMIMSRIRCRMFCSIGESIMSAVQGDRRW